MNLHETIRRIKQQFPNASNDTIMRSLDSFRDGFGSYPGKEKLEANNPRPKRKAVDADNQSRVPKGDFQTHRAFQVAITLRFSDKRRRDLTNGAETILDALVSARRQLEGDSSGHPDGGNV